MLGRTKKQIIIGTIFILIISFLFFIFYFLFLKPLPSCFDGKQNQNEEGIDCGGPCPSCQITSLKNLETLWIKAIQTKDQNYDLLAKISNPNQSYGSRQISYQFKLYDLNNLLITSKSGTTFILPRETKYIIEPKVFFPSLVSKITFDFGQIQWEKLENYQRPQIDIFDKKYQILKEGPVFFSASGIIKNSSPFDFEKIKIIVVLFNEKDEPLAVNSTEIQALLARQERYFVTPWFFEILGNVSKLEIEAQTNVFKPD